MAGAFIVFEGGEGAGKSTQVGLLASGLRALGYPVLVTREPGGTPLGEAIRELLLGTSSAGMAPRAEALLFAAARAEHAAAVIRPARDRGMVVISDRYLDSSVAYQGVARGLGAQTVAELSLWATENLVPDLTILLDVAPDLGLGRAAEANRMESEAAHFHELVRQGLRACADSAPSRYLVLPADELIETLATRVQAEVLPLLSVSGTPVTLTHTVLGAGT
ncbi:MAG: dTMP kinase [Candidatus Nanopelagicales bacterium]